MEDETKDIYYQSTNSSTSTCVVNDCLVKINTIGNTKLLNNNQGSSMDSEVLSKNQEEENSIDSDGPFCRVKLESIFKLKESTKHLLCLLEEIQTKTHTKTANETPTVTNVIRLFPQDNHDDCSIYSRLTRKCHCLNQPDYNDLIIHFNEESKYTTSTLGEIIKNMRILRKFLYIGGSYTRNALMFLNEGMLESLHSEKVEITQGITSADVCNIFDDHSIVSVCISWPCKSKYNGDYVTQALAASFLYKLAQLEEGRRYLNYSSKIINDIKKVLRKKSNCLEVDTVYYLNVTLNLLRPLFAKNLNTTCFNKSVYEGNVKNFITRAQNTFNLLCNYNKTDQAEIVKKLRRSKIIPIYTE